LTAILSQLFHVELFPHLLYIVLTAMARFGHSGPEATVQTLVQERWMPLTTEEVWKYLSDLSHFGRHDPFHHDFRFTGGKTCGYGARFILRHTYIPIFPLPSDHVVCSVTAWRPEELLTIAEKNPVRLKSHTQSFEIIAAVEGRALVRFTITYRGIPWILLPWRLWATWLVKKRMAQKLREIERECLALR
jgi:hypothetical protein